MSIYLDTMGNIDLKDRKILYHLDLNSRQSFRSIGRKVGLSKDVVTSRVKKLQEKGIISCFWTAIDTFKLGYQVFRIYINFRDITPDKKEEIIQYFVDCKDSWAVISGKGEVEFSVIFWVKDVSAFYQFWNKTVLKFGPFFEKMIISTLNHVIAYKKSFLLPDNFNKIDAEFYHLGSIGKTYEIDEIDYKIMNELAVNARIPIIELASKIGSSTKVVNYRIKNLMKKGIILSFRVAINISKVGLQNFNININLKDHSQRKSILDYLENKPFLEYIDDNIGWTDLQFEIVVESMEKLIEVTDEINIKFANAIRNQTFGIITERHKERWLPEMNFL